MSADHAQVFDDALLADGSLEHHLTLNAGSLGDLRIYRLDLANHQPSGYAGRNTDTLWSGNPRNRCIRRTDDGAHDAAHLSARDPARNSAHHASGHRRWRLFFFNHFDFLWNLGGGAELAVNNVGLHLLHYVNFCRRRRWRRWGRGRD